MLITFTYLGVFDRVVKRQSMKTPNVRSSEARQGPTHVDKSAPPPPTNPRATLETTAARRHLARTMMRYRATWPRCAASSLGPEDDSAPDGGDQLLGRGPQYCEGSLLCIPQFRARLGRDAGL